MLPRRTTKRKYNKAGAMRTRVRNFIKKYSRPALGVAYSQQRGITNYAYPFPSTLKCRLTYAYQNGSFHAGDGTSNYCGLVEFRCNSVYDPNYTNTTNILVNSQPYFYDQLSAIYGKYCVVGVKYRITCTPPNISDAFLIVRPTAGVHTPTTTQQEALWVEEQRPNSKKYCLVVGQQPRVIKGYIDVAKIYGVSKDTVRDDDTFQSAINANPDKTVHLMLLAGNADNTITNNRFSVNVKLTYMVRFFDRNVVSYS